jgi:hypothetical protein
MIRPEPTTQDKILATLEAQYTHVEAYCDAQTSLGNVYIQRGKSQEATTRTIHPYLQLEQPSPEYTALQQVRTSLHAIHQDWQIIHQLLEELNHNDKEIHAMLLRHVALSKRVLQTVQDRYHRNGIPILTSSQSSLERKTVALATLRASIARIQQAIQ